MPLLSVLGCSGLTFLQHEKHIKDSKYRAFRYHMPYLRDLPDELRHTAAADVDQQPYLEYAASAVGMMTSAMNKYYERIFETAAGQYIPDTDELFVTEHQTCVAAGLSIFKVRNTLTPTDFRPRSTKKSSRYLTTYKVSDLAALYEWNVPGTAETVEAVRQGLGELAAQYAVFTPIQTTTTYYIKPH